MLTTRPIRIEGHAPNMSNAKTPGRAILKGRGALQENALHRGAGAMTVNGKGKKVVLNSPSQLKTLRESDANPSQHVLNKRQNHSER